MKKTKTEQEAEHIARALEQPELRAFVIICGALLPFSKRAQARMLTFVTDMLAEEDANDQR